MSDGIEAIVALALAIANFIARFVIPLVDQFRKTDFKAFDERRDPPPDDE
jgi:hypothetical protein